MLLAQLDPWSGVPIGEHLWLFSPMIALVVTMLAIVGCPILLGRSTRAITTIVGLGIAVTFYFAIRAAAEVTGGGISGLSTEASAGMLVADNLSLSFQIILIVFLAAVTWLWWMGSARTERNTPEFFILLLGSALGMLLMTATTNLLMIVVAIETASLPSYALVGFDKRDRRGAEASLKYMVFGAISAAIMLYGVSLLYGLSESLSAFEVARYAIEHLTLGQNRFVLGLGLLCFLGGLAFKISAVPFHFWCPDAFEGAKIEVTTWLSVVSKAAGLILLARIVGLISTAVDDALVMNTLAPIAWVLGLMAAVTATLGNFAAYKQESVKRLLAYSSIAHAGYMMMAAALFLHPSVPGYTAGLSALLAYVVIYLFMNLGAFGVTALVYWETGTDRIGAFTGLWRRAPWLVVPMTCCLVSLIGLPPFAGFVGKYWVLMALGSQQTALGWFLVIVLVLNTLVSVYYYMRIVVQMALRDDGQAVIRPKLGGTALVNACAVVLLLLLIFANPLKRTTDRFARNLFEPAAVESVAADVPVNTQTLVSQQ